jgi:hypothetical protein
VYRHKKNPAQRGFFSCPGQRGRDDANITWLQGQQVQRRVQQQERQLGHQRQAQRRRGQRQVLAQQQGLGQRQVRARRVQRLLFYRKRPGQQRR